MKLLKIDELTRKFYPYLEKTDNCYYWHEYTAKKSFGYSKSNQLMLNLKKCPSLKEKFEYRYKEQAVSQCAELFAVREWGDCTIVPIPPSKGKKHDLYDDRLVKILELAKRQYPNNKINYTDIVEQNGDYKAEHMQTQRANVQELIARYSLRACVIPTNVIIVFDDVLTRGTHFKAVQKILSEKYPEKQIEGLFIARTVQTTLLEAIKD